MTRVYRAYLPIELKVTARQAILNLAGALALDAELGALPMQKASGAPQTRVSLSS